ncbi:MAG TPA: AAA family ATPase [Streptosporangiaceae bacterium]|jgi:predicted cytidylate kinase
MASGKSIVVSGDLGSGKSTVTKALSRRLGLRRVSVGDLYRQMALDRGMSALQLNLHAELDDAVDGYVDQLQQEIAKTDEQLVVDGRLAWFFFTDAFKVHLMTDPEVAATRVFSRPSDEVEAYASLAEAAERLRNRSDSERMRFLTRYGADKNRLRNYDLVCDTTSATADEVIAAVVAAYTSDGDGQRLPGTPPLLLLDPRHVYPAAEPVPAPAGAPAAGPASGGTGPLAAGYSGSSFFVVDGQDQLSAALRAGRHLIPATLAAEGDEPAAGGLTAHQYLASRVTPDVLRAWEQAHQVTLPPPPPAPPRSLSPAATRPPPPDRPRRAARGQLRRQPRTRPNR